MRIIDFVIVAYDCMKKLFIVANWKSNKTIYQTEEWFRTINNSPVTFNKEEKEVIVCAPFTLLPKVKKLTVNCSLSIVVGAQDISPFDEGAYTGEVNGEQIKEFADYVIIGHSERRQYFKEDRETLNRKVIMASKYNLLPIFCVQDQNTPIPPNVKIVAYEPVSAIGTGNPDTPENAEQIAILIKASNREITNVLYGGSVTSENINSFTKMSNIDGVLVGTSSLDPTEFLKIINNA